MERKEIVTTTPKLVNLLQRQLHVKHSTAHKVVKELIKWETTSIRHAKKSVLMMLRRDAIAAAKAAGKKAKKKTTKKRTLQ